MHVWVAKSETGLSRGDEEGRADNFGVGDRERHGLAAAEKGKGGIFAGYRDR